MESGQYGEAGGPANQLIDLTINNVNNNSSPNSAINELFSQSNMNPENMFNSNNLNSQLQQKSDSNDKHGLINFSLRFKETHSGPFCIYVEHKEFNIGQLHPMRVGSILSEFPADLQSSIIEVLSVGRNRIKVFMKSAASANFLIGHDIFLKHKLISYIPQHLLEKKGLVRNVDTSLSEEELLNKIVSPIPISNVKRLTRITHNASGEKVTIPRQMIVVTFSSLFIPDHVFVDYVRCPVETYISPVMQCFQCLRYGHSSRLCRGKKRCKTCGGEHEGDCTNVTFCVHCKNSNHSSTSRSCPKYLQQKNIKNVMATKNVSFKEAEKMVSNPSLFSRVLKSNPFAPLSTLDGSQFPPLDSNVSRNQISSTQRTANHNNFQKRKKQISSSIQPSSVHNAPNLNKRTKVQEKTREADDVTRDPDVLMIRNNLIKAVTELLERLHSGEISSQIQNNEMLEKQVDSIIGKVFNISNIKQSPDGKLPENSPMEL